MPLGIFPRSENVRINFTRFYFPPYRNIAPGNVTRQSAGLPLLSREPPKDGFAHKSCERLPPVSVVPSLYRRRGIVDAADDVDLARYAAYAVRAPLRRDALSYDLLLRNLC